MSSLSNERLVGRKRRHVRVRKKIHGTAERPRLALFRSNKHLVLQVIDDESGRTVAAASTNEAEQRTTGGTEMGWTSLSVLAKQAWRNRARMEVTIWRKKVGQP